MVVSKVAKYEVPKFDMIRRLRVADYFTLFNALCGVLSVFSSIKQHFVAAHILIFLGYEFDVVDGKVARWRNECSDWGKELDSFSDLVTFVVAPAVLLFCVGLQNPMDQVACALYVLCGLTRLVRFNIIVDLVPKNAVGRASYVEGLPTAYAALIISTLVAITAWMDGTTHPLAMASIFTDTFYETHYAVVPVVALSISMASRRLQFSFDGTWSVPITTIAILIGCWCVAPF